VEVGASRNVSPASSRPPQQGNRRPAMADKNVDGSSNGSMPVRALTACITSSKSVRSLLGVLGQHRSICNHIHAVAAFMQMADIIAPSITTGSTLGQSSKRALDIVGQLAAEHIADMDTRQLISLLHRMGKVRYQPANGLLGLVEDRLLAAGGARLQEAEAQGLANALWGLAWLEARSSPLVLPIMQQADAKLEQFNPQNLGNTIWALASLQGKGADPRFVSRFCTLLKAQPARLAEFNTQNLSNTIWALATMSHSDPEVMRALLAAAGPKLPEAGPQELSNTLWAMATMDYRDVGFIRQLLPAARLKLGAYTPQDLANTAWSLATLGHHEQGFMREVLGEVRRKLHSFTPQNLSNTAWAMATLGHLDKRVMRELLEEAAYQLLNFNPQNLSNTVWALATLQYYDATFLTALCAEACRKIDRFKSQDVSNTLWALATLQHYDEPLIRAAVQRLELLVCDRDHVVSAQHLANSAWGLARLGHEEGTQVGASQAVRHELIVDTAREGGGVCLYQRLAARLLALEPGAMNTRELCNMAWAHAVSGTWLPHLCQRLLKQLPAELQGGASDAIHRRQVFMYLLVLERGAQLPPATLQHPRYRALRSACLQAWREKGEPKESLAQQEVAALMRQLLPGCDLREEQVTDDSEGLFSIDIFFQEPGGSGRKMAVEVDGPTHFMTNMPGRATGDTLLRDRLLASLGYEVVVVPGVEWAAARPRTANGGELQFSTQQEVMLRHILQQHGVQAA